MRRIKFVNKATVTGNDRFGGIVSAFLAADQGLNEKSVGEFQTNSLKMFVSTMRNISRLKTDNGGPVSIGK